MKHSRKEAQKADKMILRFLWLIFSGRAHCEVTGFGQDVHGFRHLRIVSHDENSIANHTSISSSHDIEPQLELDERAVAIDRRGCHFVCWISRRKITEGFVQRICDLEFFRL